MPDGDEEWSWELPERPADSAPAPAQQPQPSFGRTVGFTVAGTALPGLGLIAAHRRVVGGIVLGVFAASLIALAIYAGVDLQGFLANFVNPDTLTTIAIVLPIVAVVWVGVVVASHLALRGTVTSAQRVAGGVLVGFLAFAVAAPLAVAARYSYDTAASVRAVFKSEKTSKSATRPTLGPGGGEASRDPFADKPRLNVLLLGGDAGKGRTGTRTDTVILASIDTQTGNTTLFSLPRNTGRMPFPSDSPLRKYYPNGFTNGDGNNAEYFLNAIYDNVPREVPKNVLGETDNLGADALKLSVGAALGLDVDYYVLINLDGFSKMINALGGIRLNVNSYIPMGGNTDLGIPPKKYLKPGPDQKLTGREALWYARGRYGSDDFARMDRQRCVINAIIDQANPANMLSRYEDIAKAGKQLVYTDMPQEVLPLMVDLSLRAKGGSVRSIVFKHGVDGFISPNPDYAQMRKRVKKALGEGAPAEPSPGESPSDKPKKPKSPESEDLADSCAYNPKVAATSRPHR